MKRIISIVMLVCMLASMFSVSAWAEERTVSLERVEFTFDASKDNREAISITFKSSDGSALAQNSVVVELWRNGSCVGTAQYNGGAGESISANFVLAGKASGSWSTKWFAEISADENSWPDTIKLSLDGNENYMYEDFTYTGQGWLGNFDDWNNDAVTPDVPEERDIELSSFEYIHYANEDATYGDRESISIGFKSNLIFGTPVEAGEVTVKLYNGDTMLSSSTLKKAVDFEYGMSCQPVLSGRPSSSWDTKWYSKVSSDFLPNKVVLEFEGKTYTFTNFSYRGNLGDFTEFNPESGIVAPGNPAPAAPAVSNPYAVPATADNSNMPLWGALFVAFAAVALLTGKKRRA